MVSDMRPWWHPALIALESANLLVQATGTCLQDSLNNSQIDPVFRHPDCIKATLTTMKLRHFMQGRGKSPIVVLTPYAIHDARIVDLAQDHSILDVLLETGLPLWLVQWRSATSSLAGLGVDALMADLHAAIDLIGEPVQLIGLCQGGWMACLYAATFTQKVRSLTIVGAPIDCSAASSPATVAALGVPSSVMSQIMTIGDGLVHTSLVFANLIARTSSSEAIATVLQLTTTEMEANRPLVDQFRAWNFSGLRLPGRYFQEVHQWLFQENRLATGRFPIFGIETSLATIHCPVFVMAGGKDTFAPAAQSTCLHQFIGTDSHRIKILVEADCDHLGLFLGKHTLIGGWRTVCQFLLGNDQ